MKTDSELKRDVLTQLELEAKIDPAALGVSVENGVVTLRGSVASEAERASTEHAVRFLAGVKGLVDDDLTVGSRRRPQQNDAELQAAAREAIEWLTTVPQEAIQVTAQDGWLTLDGEVESPHQAQCLEDIMREIPGVHGVRNALSVKAECPAT